MRLDHERYHLVLSPTLSKLQLLHKNSNVTISKPLTIPNAKSVGKVVGLCFTNTKFKKMNYKFREQEDLTNFKHPITIQTERAETLSMF